MRTTQTIVSAVVITAGVAALAPAARAQVVTLQDRNSSATFNPDTQAGQSQWIVNGTNHMFQQWFWLRATGDTAERSVNTLTKNFQTTSDTNTAVDNRIDTLNLRYTEPAATGARYQTDLTFTLRGGPTGQTLSDITESLIIRNISNVPLTFSFFEYCDFDMNGSAGGDIGQIINGRIASQFDGPAAVSETVVTPAPSRWQIDLWPVILNSLNDAAITNLNNNSGPLGPNDLAWAFQWDFTLNPGGEFLISKDKQITPAPGAASLLALAGLAAARRRRR